jgi:hypothetical protein
MHVLDSDTIGDGHGYPSVHRGGSRPSAKTLGAAIWIGGDVGIRDASDGERGNCARR